jgi:alpha-mannosidase
VEVFCGPAARPVVCDDPSDTWSHNIFSFHGAAADFQVESVRLVEAGPVRSTLRAVSCYGASRLVQEFSLYRELEQVEGRVGVDWREHQKILKLRFPLNLSHMTSTAEIPYGHIERRTAGEEEPCGSWVDVSGMSRDTGRPYGLSLLNDGKYGYDVDLRDLGLTVLRSPLYAHHVPFAPDQSDEHAWIDQGLQEFRYTLLPHAGSWEEAGTVRRAAELNATPIPLVSTFHPQGSLPQSESFVSVDQDNVLVTALKKSEESDDLILRVVEVHREAVRATIHLKRWSRWIEADFGPCEIKTFRIPRDPRQPVMETDLLEWTEAERLAAGETGPKAKGRVKRPASASLGEASQGIPGNGHSKGLEA